MSFKIFIVSIKAFYVRSAGADLDLEGGCRGCAPPRPRDDLRFSNTTGILKKKRENYVVYWC